MNICFIGGGNMATAIIGGLCDAGYAAAQLRAVEINADNRARLQSEFGVSATAELAAGVAGSDVVVLAVKPQQLREVAAQLAPLLGGQLVVSIAAGIRATDLARWLGTQHIVRVMPNTPALVRSGISGLYALPEVSQKQREAAQSILNAVGNSLWLDDEAMMDAVTAVSGSGPAYVFYFIEAMLQAARELGFDEAQSKLLVTDTFLGATKLAQSGTEDAGVLRARVTSKNGTTERALLSMEADQVKQSIIKAAHVAAERSREMGDELGGV
ncbi:MAG: pyrroline-5-carboxylate reductase [Sideroxydans sp.]|nr:pyrroline-5-carboxylate reductase [Sideroxydans sp.]